jgi:hypothetical protein
LEEEIELELDRDTELDRDKLDAELERDELTTDVVPPLQAAPVTAGRSAEPPFFVPWNPKETDWPAAIFPFQDILVAV